MTLPLEKIIEAADKAGFTSELRAASIIANSTWRVSQNVYFIDKDERKGRELDISAYKIFSSTDNKPEVSCTINLCIEVKKTQDPFIFYTSKKHRFEGSAGYGIFHWKNNVDRHVLSYDGIELKRPHSKIERLARSYSNFKTGQTQQIQSGIISAFKASIHERDNCNEVYSDLSGDLCFFMPIMVVDGPMYECFLEDGTNAVVAREVEEIVYVQNYHSEHYGRVSNRVSVLNLAALGKRLPEYTTWGDHMLKVMMQNRNKVAASKTGVG